MWTTPALALAALGFALVNADSADVDVSFSQDSSGALAAIGVNNFFSGSDARDIAVNDRMKVSMVKQAINRTFDIMGMRDALAFGMETEEPEVVQFAVEVGSPEVLKMLYVLTLADLD